MFWAVLWGASLLMLRSGWSRGRSRRGSINLGTAGGAGDSVRVPLLVDGFSTAGVGKDVATGVAALFAGPLGTGRGVAGFGATGGSI